MDKKYRDMTKPKLPYRKTVTDPDSPTNQVKQYLTKEHRINRRFSKTKQEILEDLPNLSWHQIYGVFSDMRRRGDAYKDEYKRLYPDMEPKERDAKINDMLFKKFGEKIIQFDPSTGKHGELTWRRQNIVNQKQEAQHFKGAVRVANRRVNNREEGVTVEALEGGHIGLSITTGTITDNLRRHDCGRLVGPSMGFCPQCGMLIGPQQIDQTKQIESGNRKSLSE